MQARFATGISTYAKTVPNKWFVEINKAGEYILLQSEARNIFPMRTGCFLGNYRVNYF